MREILFRGKRIDNDEWVYGDLVRIGNKSYITHCVDPDTVGQYTGMTDKNDKKIFEGDILEISTNEYREIELVEYDTEENSGYAFSYKAGMLLGDWDRHYINVIGNIHDNPELLKSRSQERRSSYSV